MENEDLSQSIADATKPNAGRIYDYLLGGQHNFEVDRVAGEEMKKLMPVMPKMFRLIRWFLSEAVRRLSAEGYVQFVDFASGLPTVDHIHVVAPPGTKIIYSDIDPITVKYGEELVKELPDVRYIHADALEPERLLESKAATEMFGTDRKVAVGYNGIVWFLPDEKFARAMKVVYDWVDSGSKLFLTTDDTPKNAQNDSTVTEVSERYSKMSQPFYWKTREKIEELIKPWKLVDPGFQRVEDWIDLKSTVSDEMHTTYQSGGMFGAFFVKE